MGKKIHKRQIFFDQPTNNLAAKTNSLHDFFLRMRPNHVTNGSEAQFVCTASYLAIDLNYEPVRGSNWYWRHRHRSKIQQPASADRDL